MITQNKLECKRCGHKWAARVESPINCPLCHSPYWKSVSTHNVDNRANCRFETKKAIKHGIIIPLKKCEVCGEPSAIIHHNDYSNPLNVMFLCRRCHFIEHERTHKSRTFIDRGPNRVFNVGDMLEIKNNKFSITFLGSKRMYLRVCDCQQSN
jgi:ribosomal protein S27AE